MRYHFERVDTATRVHREHLLKEAVGWGTIPTDRPQFALFDGESLADWPLMDTFEDAVKTCKSFNTPDDQDDAARSEAIWQARMAGDMSA